MKRQQMTISALTAGFVLTLGVIGALVGFPGTAPQAVIAEQERSSPPSMEFDDETQQAIDVAEQVSRAYQAVAERITPSVVNITTQVEMAQRQPRRGGRGLDPFSDDFLERFFGDDWDFFFGPRQPRNQPQPEPDRDMPPQLVPRGQGSGVIVREDGYIITNYHVIAQADRIDVRLSNGRSYDAEVVGTDRETDLAVIKIEATGLTPAAFGSSDALVPGQSVIAIGNPFGLEATVTAGVVSATGRGGMGIAQLEHFIQTDAAINPGNSGGPLLNLNGEVVGINTAIASRTGAFIGVGFAIPSSIANAVLDSVIETGEVYRGWLGVGIQDLTTELAESFGYPNLDGVLVNDVTPDSPAAQAGIEPGDIITRLDGQSMSRATQLQANVITLSPDTDVMVEIFRDGEHLERTITLGVRPSPDEQVTQRPDRPEPALGDMLGMRVEELSSREARQLNISQDAGVIVRDVERGSLAARAGVRPGDVIMDIGPHDISSVQDFEEAIDEYEPGDALRMRIRRGAGTVFIIVRIPSN